ncbi:glycosyltransferase family protein [uncultured Microscilla sp.]|uniref:glycosyltransferase family protein n=1 Tax=uncultured Microscilla sp. TaxID=432653 RepID=UPI0026253362|nr:glycosyltransferase family protein [uncultured Microscilla sp.]
MKILYAVQGTGNGHVSRAIELIPLLQQYGEVDVFLSGNKSQVKIPYDIKYKSKGITFSYTKKGGLAYWTTLRELQFSRAYKEMRQFPIEQYDVVLNDFEPITAWACRLKKKPCLGFGHQASFQSKAVPRPKHFDLIGEAVLKRYAPASHYVGLHFDKYDQNIFLPILRKELYALPFDQQNHYTIYLSHYHHQQVVPHLLKVTDTRFDLFSKHCTHKEIHKNVTLQPIDGQAFMQSLASGSGMITGAGFEGPAEAITLGKKLLVLPILGQYEQWCNAEAMRRLGIKVVRKINKDFSETLKDWLAHTPIVHKDYPNQTQQILDYIFTEKLKEML